MSLGLGCHNNVHPISVAVKTPGSGVADHQSCIHHGALSVCEMQGLAFGAQSSRSRHTCATGKCGRKENSHPRDRVGIDRYDVHPHKDLAADVITDLWNAATKNAHLRFNVNQN
jgi:hypothetical protein